MPFTDHTPKRVEVVGYMTSHDIDAIVTMLDRDDITPEPSDAKNYGKQYKITLLIEEF